jgi:hypothetical protein
MMNKFIILDKTIGVNGPSISLGVPFSIFGIAISMHGIAKQNEDVIWIGISCLLLASYLILSLNCISINKFTGEIFLYREYFISKHGKKHQLCDYDSVRIYLKMENARHGRYNWNKTQLKTYSVVLLSKSGKKLILKESGNLSNSKKFQQHISLQTGVELKEGIFRD